MEAERPRIVGERRLEIFDEDVRNCLFQHQPVPYPTSRRVRAMDVRLFASLPDLSCEDGDR